MHKNLIFDLGNVLYDYNRKDIVSKFIKDEKDIDLVVDIIFKYWPVKDYGTISDKQFNDMYKNDIPKRLHQDVENFLHNWIYYFVPIKEMEQILIDLRKTHKLYILSNMPVEFAHKENHFVYEKYFDGIVYSCNINLVKPDIKIYKYILDKYNLNPKDCLFIDDHQINLDMAKKINIDTYLFNKRDIDSFRKYIIENE